MSAGNVFGGKWPPEFTPDRSVDPNHVIKDYERAQLQKQSMLANTSEPKEEIK